MNDFLKQAISYENLHWQIAGALILACIFGYFADGDTAIFGVNLVEIFSFFGGLFMNALKMIVVPLILAAIIMGVSNMAGQESFGRIGGKTVGLYVVTGFFAIFTGLLLVNLIAPGDIDPDQAQALVESISEDDVEVIQSKVKDRSAADLVDIIARAIPSNILVAASEMNLLALIFVGIVFGTFMTRLKGDIRVTMERFWQGIHDIMVVITIWIMRFAPIGVLALVGKVLMLSGFEVFSVLLWFFITVLLALAIHFFVWLPLMLRFIGGINPIKYYSKIVRAQLTAFSTASSSATLPVTINSAEKAGVSTRVTSFVLPLGATVNMDGTALYECVVVIFIAQIYAATTGTDFSFAQQLTVVVMALLTSIGVAGIPAASLVAITLILTMVGLPAEWIGIVLAVDRILDMCRTSTNVTSDLTITALIASTEKEELSEIRAQGSSTEAEAA
ncbi:MAG: dicarboxylate/amino acid:cation symporter [Gammaproteobacteria bacterium]|nr:dicarboxylate/amino acid:cation symporter [Gammaproteobacteria bacterium]